MRQIIYCTYRYWGGLTASFPDMHIIISYEIFEEKKKTAFTDFAAWYYKTVWRYFTQHFVLVRYVEKTTVKSQTIAKPPRGIDYNVDISTFCFMATMRYIINGYINVAALIFEILHDRIRLWISPIFKFDYNTYLKW